MGVPVHAAAVGPGGVPSGQGTDGLVQGGRAAHHRPRGPWVVAATPWGAAPGAAATPGTPRQRGGSGPGAPARGGATPGAPRHHRRPRGRLPSGPAAAAAAPGARAPRAAPGAACATVAHAHAKHVDGGGGGAGGGEGKGVPTGVRPIARAPTATLAAALGTRGPIGRPGSLHALHALPAPHALHTLHVLHALHALQRRRQTTPLQGPWGTEAAAGGREGPTGLGRRGWQREARPRATPRAAPGTALGPCPPPGLG